MIQKLPKAIRACMVAAAAVLVLMAFTAAGETVEAPVHAGHHGSGDHHSQMHGGAPMEAMKRILSSLNLTEAQRADIQAIVAKGHPVLRPLTDDVVSARLDLNAAVSAPTPNESAIRAATERLVQVQTAVALQHAQIVSEIRKVLTPDQQQMFDEQRIQMRDKVETRMRHRHAHGGKHDDRSEKKSGAKGERSDDDSSSETKE